MNTHKALWIPLLELAIVGLILLAIASLGILILIAYPQIHIPTGQPLDQADPLNLINAFHFAVNSGDADAILALLSEDATINDGGSIIQGREEIQDWALHSPRMAGLRLTLISSQTTGRKISWRDLARNEQEVPYQPYILQWMAIIQEGKIKTLAVSILPMPDGK